ncbi:MAG: hypothetical protein ACTSU7_11310 [Candidatus Heimdallarchaeaceae archaeon]
MAWGRISKGIDWTGARIGDTGDILHDLTVSGSKQTARGVLISDDSLMDTFHDTVEKTVKREKKRTAFMSKLNEDETKSVNKREAELKKMIERKQ